MTEEFEKKLDELLGFKKQMEEATSEQRKKNTLSVLEKYKKEERRAGIRSRIALIILCDADRRRGKSTPLDQTERSEPRRRSRSACYARRTRRCTC